MTILCPAANSRTGCKSRNLRDMDSTKDAAWHAAGFCSLAFAQNVPSVSLPRFLSLTRAIRCRFRIRAVSHPSKNNLHIVPNQMKAKKPPAKGAEPAGKLCGAPLLKRAFCGILMLANMERTGNCGCGFVPAPRQQRKRALAAPSVGSRALFRHDSR